MKSIRFILTKHKNYLRSIFLILIFGCASKTLFLPEGVTLGKNQMIYRDNPMGIWTQDWEGKYHHYAPEDSTQYYSLTHNFGIQLENAFFGHCKRHSKIEIVNITPALITVMNMPDRNKSFLANKNNSIDLLSPTDVDSSRPNQISYPTDAQIRSEMKGDKKN